MLFEPEFLQLPTSLLQLVLSGNHLTASQAPAPATSPPSVADDDTILEILATGQATAALSQAVPDARGALVKTAELVWRQDGAAETDRVLAESETLDQHLQATSQQAGTVA